MPTYDYVCRACEHRFEHYASMTEPALLRCPKCGRDKLERLIGAGAGILFKGSGFYETDYKRAGSKSEVPKSDAPKADAPKGDGPKADAPAPAKSGKDTGKGPPSAGGSGKDAGAPKAPDKSG